MVECNPIEVPTIYPNLNDQQQFRLIEVRDYFIAEVRERKLMSKRLSNILFLLIILINLCSIDKKW